MISTSKLHFLDFASFFEEIWLAVGNVKDRLRQSPTIPAKGPRRLRLRTSFYCNFANPGDPHNLWPRNGWRKRRSFERCWIQNLTRSPIIPDTENGKIRHLKSSKSLLYCTDTRSKETIFETMVISVRREEDRSNGQDVARRHLKTLGGQNAVPPKARVPANRCRGAVTLCALIGFGCALNWGFSNVWLHFCFGPFGLRLC